MAKILITGGSGFIGTNLLDKLIKDNHNILNIDIKEPKNKNHIDYWVDTDITDFTSFKKTVENFSPNYIIHLAARTDLDGLSLADYNTNTIGVENLMNIVKSLKSLKKVLITSSMLVCRANYVPLDQTDYCPTTIYGESKVITENYVWKNQPSCDWAILRPSSIWGPWFNAPYKSFFDMILNKKYFHIGDKSCTKTYGYISNSILQIEKVLFFDTTEFKNKVFYLGDYEPTNIEVWANQISEELNYKIKKVPYIIVKIAAIIGDFLKFFKIRFPLNTFRLKNMTTNNNVNLSSTLKLAPNLPYTRVEGVKRTINWIKINK